MKAPEYLGSHKVSEPLGFHGKPGCKFRTTRAYKFSVPTIWRRCKTTESVPRRTSDKRATEVSGAEG